MLVFFAKGASILQNYEFTKSGTKELAHRYCLNPNILHYWPSFHICLHFKKNTRNEKKSPEAVSCHPVK